MDIPSVINSIGGFLQILRKNIVTALLATILFIVIVSAGTVSYVAVTNLPVVIELYERYFPNSEAEAKNAQAAIPVGQDTCRAIDKLQTTTQADRATFWIFTNHSTALNGQVFTNATLYCQTPADGIAPLSPPGPIPNSMSAEIMAALFPDSQRTECGKWYVEELESAYLRASMRKVGSDVIYECGVRDSNFVQLGKVTASYHFRASAPPDAEIFKRLREASERIGYFNSIQRD